MAGKLAVAVAAAMTLALAGVPRAGADGGGRVVQTDKGAVSGTVTSGYRLFGSIPHAAAPVGPNRWRDPRPVAPWRGVRDASKPSPACAQTPQLGERGSDVEDCLYLVSGYEFAERDMPMIFPDMLPFPGGYGAYHASELPLLFEFEGVPLTPGQRALSDYVVTAWGRFARTGDPGWEAQVLSLAAGAVGPADFTSDRRCDFWGQQ
ncbi:carboxylesterase family protein [Lentzea atacamensis]|uniref:Carboxylesterase family protein n=1 Tax=Lentzea atacamensis TaxID=531938 RepID=A0ABX9EFI3_9PSEU|nr:carboxylesterase family protein [Lentzea atacamensis]RAS69950.1 carboxylesterase family protein [Lentzea atacamensis]